ncbi:MAG TPA: hypothetical protein VNZ26_03570, partial [Vicinamibacterales bacterium]|nr:hypothetical protein [Vicinamibacterales bacterium]
MTSHPGFDPLYALAVAIALTASAAEQVPSGRGAPSLVEPGVLPARWTTGGPNCLELPAWQIHEYNPTFYILRESGCIHYEKPFLYLILGREKALLEDTGAGEVQTAPVVIDLIARWANRNNRPAPPLIVVHSHSHSDHTAGDGGFRDIPGVQLVPASVPALQKAFQILT